MTNTTDVNQVGLQSPSGLLQSYQEAVDWITGLYPFGIRPGLDRIEQLMEQLGNPHRRLKFIHVAGTNGKGSTCSFLANILQQSGYDTGMFTSPYITKFTNRFQYNGEDIQEETLLSLANKLKPYVDAMAQTELGSPTMFEVSTALAVLFFAEVAYPDYVVWETGLGGRLDVTNIVNPVISIITNIGHDHMDKLGDTVESIAFEKAGIIKPGRPVVSAVLQPEAIEVIKKTAIRNKSTLYLLGEQFHELVVNEQQDEQCFRFEGPFRALEQVSISLNGAHQRMNAAVALMAIEVMRQYDALVVDDENLLTGLKTAAWPGRLEMISKKPRLLIDGAHNPEGAQMLAKALQTTYAYDRLHIVVAMLDNKNHRDTLKHILPLADSLIVTEPDYRMKMDAVKLAEVIGQLQTEVQVRADFKLEVEPDWKTALSKLQQLTGENDLGLVTGTLYLIADVRSRILFHSEAEKGW